jgi:ABC-type glycerol-3-phosphate transport system permease component
VLSSDISTQPMTVVIAALQARHAVPFALLNAAGVLAILIPAAVTLGLSRYIVKRTARRQRQVMRTCSISSCIAQRVRPQH